MWITWKHQDTDFPQPLKLQDKIAIYYERIYGWQLHVADLMVNGGVLLGDDKQVECIPHSGFACLQVCLSYFETTAKYQDGFIGKGQSRKYFKKGIKLVFPLLQQADPEILELFLDGLYEGARCGLYHASMTHPGIALGQTPSPMALSEDDKIVINPNKVPFALKDHLKRYRDHLTDPKNTTMRANFERRFDFDLSYDS